MLLNDDLWKEIKNRFMDDSELKEIIRNSFVDAVSKYIGIHVTVDSSQRKCPVCRNDMVLRLSRTNGVFFWGCKCYPPCKGREDATEKDIEEFAKRYPEKWEILKKQKEAFDAGGEETVVPSENWKADVEKMIEEVSKGKPKRSCRKK